MKLFLIRHAQTTMNVKGKVFSGMTDCSLSQQGIEITQRMSQWPIWKTMEHVYVTPLIRTSQTADILFSREIPRTVVPALSEMNFGEYEGILISEENEKDPIINKWNSADEDLTFPNGENLKEHGIASLRALIDLAEKETCTRVAVVSHATTIRLILSLLLSDSIQLFRRIPCDNSCFTVLEYSNHEFKINCINNSIII